MTNAERKAQLHAEQAHLFLVKSHYRDEARRIEGLQQPVFDEWMSLMGASPDAPFAPEGECVELGAGRGGEVERLRAVLYREARAQEERGDMGECWRLLGLIFQTRHTPPMTEEERRELGAIATCYSDPLPGPPL